MNVSFGFAGLEKYFVVKLSYWKAYHKKNNPDPNFKVILDIVTAILFPSNFPHLNANTEAKINKNRDALLLCTKLSALNAKDYIYWQNSPCWQYVKIHRSISTRWQRGCKFSINGHWRLTDIGQYPITRANWENSGRLAINLLWRRRSD